ISISGSPGDLTVYQGAVWVTDISDRSIIRIDPAAAVATDTIPLDSAPTALAAGYGALWAVESTTGELVRVDVSTLARRPIHVGGAPANVTVGEGSMWVTTTTG
ncbi:MAG TPA: hypothetical protein DIT48_08295, partial [Actinobacteria bacterium]|nr:hypothetical protein [Actinomycetota bacterium]